MKEKRLVFHGQGLASLQGYKLQRRQLGKGISEALSSVEESPGTSGTPEDQAV